MESLAETDNAGPSVTTVQAFWEGHVNNEYYTKERRASSSYFDQIEARRYRWHYHLRDLFDSLEGSSGALLEIGCGIGVDSVQLARCGFQVTGIDLTQSAIDVAKSHARHRGLDIDFRLGNAETLHFPDGQFDIVYSFGVLHHTPDMQKAIAEVHRVLKPKGRALIMLYHRHSIVDWVHRLFRLPYESPRTLQDHCPVVYRVSAAEARTLFAAFSEVSIEVDYPFTYGFRHLTFWMPKWLLRAIGRRLGWHLMIDAHM